MKNHFVSPLFVSLVTQFQQVAGRNFPDKGTSGIRKIIWLQFKGNEQ